MPLDAVCISALRGELSERLLGMKADKIQQPERDIILISLRGRAEAHKLLLSAATGSARIHLTGASYEQPQSPPMFCMLLRKHLQGARIAGFEQPSGERVLFISFNTFDEMGYPSVKRLALELLGRSPNLILIDAEGIIIDCLRRVELSFSERSRQVLPGLKYHLPPAQEKPEFFSSEVEQRRELLLSAPADISADKWLQQSFCGISPLLCREICSRAFFDVSKRIGSLSEAERDAFLAQMDELCGIVATASFRPTLLQDGKTPRDFSFIPINQYGEAYEQISYADFSSLLEAFYTRRDQIERMARRSRSLYKTVKTARDREARKLGLRREELSQCAGRDRLRKFGDLVTSNIYRAEKGLSEIIVDDYYEEDCPRIAIPLDPRKTPQQNAARYYKDYNKAKNAEKYLNELIKKGETELIYLESVLSLLERVSSDRDLAALRLELEISGYLKKRSGAKREKPFAPLRFRSSSGHVILVGRSNAQNDELSLKTARRTDIWLHAQKIHGSHVILCCEDEEPNEGAIYEAASLAAHFSAARGGGKTPIDYTMVKFVKKPSGSLPGMVIYTGQKTIIAEGDEDLAERLRENA